MAGYGTLNGASELLQIRNFGGTTMMRFISIGIDCFSSLVFIIPVVILLQYALFKQRNLNKMFWVFIFAFYCMAVFSVTGIPTAYTWNVDFSFNFIPLMDVVNSPAAYLENTILNIILFMPMGFLLPAVWKEYRSIKMTMRMGFAISTIIELLQIFTFRLTDIDDLITNTLGTFLGFYCCKIFLFKLPLRTPADAEKTSMKYEPVIILTAVFLTAFFLKPIISNEIWDIILSGSLWKG